MLNFSGLSRSKWIGKMMRAPLMLVPSGVAVPVLQGPLAGYRWVTGSATHGCWLGSYELAKQLAIMESLQPGQVFFDVGANVGFYTLLGSKRVGDDGRVFSFEPFPENIKCLDRHLQLNRVTNVEVIPSAVSDCIGVGSFGDATDAHMGRLCSDGEIEVELVTLDAFIEQHQVTPQAIKIDVEGAELGVLKGAERFLSNHAPTIFLATHGSRVHRACLQFLDTLGYACRPLDTEKPVEKCDELVARKRVSIDRE